MNTLLVISLALLCVGMVFGQAVQPIVPNAFNNCSFTYNNNHYDFSSLIAKSGSYVFTQTLNNVSYLWQLQVCGNIAKPVATTCNVLSSAVNQVEVSNNNCTYLGQGSLFSWDENPGQDGFYLTYYHGQDVTSDQGHSARIYFMCNDTAGKPVVEHMTTFYQYHISWNTPLACPGAKRKITV